MELWYSNDNYEVLDLQETYIIIIITQACVELLWMGTPLLFTFLFVLNKWVILLLFHSIPATSQYCYSQAPQVVGRLLACTPWRQRWGSRYWSGWIRCQTREGPLLKVGRKWNYLWYFFSYVYNNLASVMWHEVFPEYFSPFLRPGVNWMLYLKNRKTIIYF